MNKFKIVIKYLVTNDNVDKEINETIDYEYYKNGNTEEIFSDKIEFSDKAIVITGTRSKEINIENCWKSKYSNYRRSIISSLFYLFNFYQSEIDVQQISIISNNDEVIIPHSEDFLTGTLNNQFIHVEKIKQYLFSKISFPDESDLMFRVLQTQIQYLKEKKFHFAYRMFNIMYSYRYDDPKKDKQAILDLLTSENINENLQKSIKLSKDFFFASEESFKNLMYNWIINDEIEAKQFSDKICFNTFQYKNVNILNMIKSIIDTYYNSNGQYKSYKKMSFKCLEKSLKLNDDTLESEIDYLRIIVLYAQFRRNKILHGANIDPDFFISNINLETLDRLSNIIYQLSIDLFNLEFSKS